MRGQALARSGKTEEALAEFDKAIALDPHNAQALYNRGLLYQNEKQHQLAIDDFTAANGLTPQRAEPLLGRAISYLALDKAKEAAADLDEAVQADPQNAQIWTTRGLAYERLGDKTKAAGSYSRAINLRPRDEAARSGFARVGGKPGQSYDALTCTESGICRNCRPSAIPRETPISPPTARLRQPLVCWRGAGSIASACRSSGREARNIGRRHRTARIFGPRTGGVRRPS